MRIYLHQNCRSIPIGHAHLKETATWAKFLAITGFVVSCLLVVVALFSGVFLNSLRNSNGYGSAMPMSAGLISGIYLVIAVVYFLLSLYLFRFAVRMK